MGDLDLKDGHEADDEPKERGTSARSQRRHRAKEREGQDAIAGRLNTIFVRLAQSLEGRGDDELAAVIREDSGAMVGGLVSVTRRVPAAATAIVAGLAVLEPLIAFGRVFRLLLRRSAERRAAYAAEWPADDEQPGDHPPAPAPPAAEPAPDDTEARPWELS